MFLLELPARNYGHWIHIDDNDFTNAEGGSDEEKTTPLKFGEKYICTTDNSSGTNEFIGTYMIFYADGSGIDAGQGISFPVGTFTYTETELTMPGQPSELKEIISADGTTLTQTENGEIDMVWTLESAI